MKKSLKTRIAVSFLLLTVISLVAIGVVHLFFLEDYYLTGKKNQLITAKNMISVDRNNNVSEDYTRFCAMNGLSFLLADNNLNLLVINVREDRMLTARMFGSIMGKENENSEILEQETGYQILKYSDPSASVDYLEIFGMTDDGYIYIIRCPLQSIHEAAELSLRFYIVVGIIVIAASVLVILLITGNIMTPITELSNLSVKMAGLDFNARYTSGGSDEIGVLGENFNIMSDRLEQSISQLKTANAQLEKDIAEKTQIDEMRREFLSSVSHELKTPIALIAGYAEGLKEMQLDEESRNYYCDVIMDEANKMNKLVMELLSLNHLESGEDRLDIQRFDLIELISGVVEAHRLNISAKGITLEFDRNRKVPVWGDQFKIGEVITNYLSNACNYCEGEKIIRINVSTAGNQIVTTVFNTGNHIPEDSLDKIWNKFYKVDKARTRAYGGSGLGLSIVKAIMDAHGQSCWAANVEGGVSFSFTLPIE